jgi:hypothetical protein
MHIANTFSIVSRMISTSKCSWGAVMVLVIGVSVFAGDAPRATEPEDVASAAEAVSMPLAAISQRYVRETDEVPDFQRHVSPLFGRLGCNGRACHGSFQGQGGFKLSLFGYDHAADMASLVEKDTGRIDVAKPGESLILRKPTLQTDHEGGERFKADSWEYRTIARWIAGGAKGARENSSRLERLAIEPAEISFTKQDEMIALKAVAHWSDGTQEDVTPLCRFKTNDESVATVNDDGRVTSKSPGNTHIVAFYDNGVTPVQVIRPVSDLTGANYPSVPTPTKIDELVVAKLQKLGIVPSEVATDAEFLRRVTLDMTGTLPTPTEIEAFLADKSAGKRQKKIEELLASPGYAMWWTTKLCDWTGNNPRRAADQQVSQQQAQQWYDWIHRRVAENMPYDKIVEGIALAVGRMPGQSYEDYCQEMSSYFHEKPADFSKRETMPYFWSRAREGAQAKEKAMSFSYAFLGVRLQCAECHKHPFDQWTKDDFDQFTAFFEPVVYANTPQSRKQFQDMTSAIVGDAKGGMAQRKLSDAVKGGATIPWREVFVAGGGRPNNPARGKNAKNKNRRNMASRRVVTPRILGEDETTDVARGEDPRAALMEWMRERDNPYFARSFVNRVWAAYFNVGIIEPPDDLNLANPPSNEPLLDYLTSGFVDRGYDMKWLHREIANSRTYQLSWKVNGTNRLDERNFSRAVLRRLPAEVAYDAITLATASDIELVAFRDDISRRAIGPASLGPRRGTSNFALQAFGRPERVTSCDCERSVEPSLLQSLFLRNDQDVLRMIDRPEGWLKQVTAGLGEEKRSQPARDVADRKSDGEGQKDIRQLRRQIAMIEGRAKRLDANGETEQAQRARRRVERLKRQLREAVAESRENSAPKAKELEKKREDSVAKKAADTQRTAEPDIQSLIRSAYLRTLSRPPTEEEEQRIRRHLGATGKVEGMRDLIWALVNSKEFIVNH